MHEADKVNEPFMQRALELAMENLGSVSPNPSVGAVIVKKNEIISEGRTSKKCHAEREAITDDAYGATMYVTLEPCCHTNKKTPPCTEAIIDAGIKKIVIATLDKNPEVNGMGIEMLEEAGIDVTYGLLEHEANVIYEPFFKWITTGIPFVTLKVALTSNGKITWGNEKRKKITGKEADKKIHEFRSKCDAILVGVETVIKDDPQLTARLVEGSNPLRVILDSSLRTPISSKIFEEEGKTMIFCAKGKKSKKLSQLAEIVNMQTSNDRISLKAVLKHLGDKGITHLMVEGGATVATSFLDEKLVDKAIFFMSSFEKKEGRGFIENLKEELQLTHINIIQLGDDIMIEGYP